MATAQQTTPIAARTGEQFLAGLSGDSREIWLNGEKITHPLEHDSLRQAALSMARVYTAGQGLMLKGGYGGLAGVNTPVSTPEEAVAAVNAQLDKGVDVITQ